MNASQIEQRFKPSKLAMLILGRSSGFALLILGALTAIFIIPLLILAFGFTSAPVHASSAYQAASAPNVQIISPRNNAIVPIGDITVEIATENFPLDGDNHWHLYVDGKLLAMVGNRATSWTTPITTSGPHDIKASLADAQHEELASATIQVTAAPASPRGTVFNLAMVAPVMGALVVGILLLIGVSLRMTRRPATGSQ